jgi:hypothetical protein
MSHRNARIARIAMFWALLAVPLSVLLLWAAPLRAESVLPPELSPGVPVLVTEPTVGGSEPAAEVEPGPREPTREAKPAPPTRKKKKKHKRSRPWASSKRVSLDLARRGGLRALGLAYRFFGHLDVGYTGLLGRRTGSEVHATLFTSLGRLRPLVTAGVPVYNLKGVLRPGFRGIFGLEWRPARLVGLYANVTASYFGKALTKAKVEPSSVRPGFGFLLYL